MDFAKIITYHKQKLKQFLLAKNRQPWYIFVRDTDLEKKTEKICICNNLYKLKVTTFNKNVSNISLTIYNILFRE